MSTKVISTTKLAKFDTQVRTIERAEVISDRDQQDELYSIIREEGWRIIVGGPLILDRRAHPTKFKHVVERTLEEEE